MKKFKIGPTKAYFITRILYALCVILPIIGYVINADVGGAMFALALIVLLPVSAALEFKYWRCKNCGSGLGSVYCTHCKYCGEEIEWWL